MASLTTSIKHFTSINRAPGPTWTETSKRKIHPFSRFDREPLRELAPLPGTTLTPAIVNTTTSVTFGYDYTCALTSYGRGKGILEKMERNLDNRDRMATWK